MKILFFASDNSKTSGAFLCMVELCREYQKRPDMEPMVVLPYEGDGKPLLDALGVRTRVIKSCTWAIPMEWSLPQRLYYFCKASLYNLPAIRAVSRLIREEEVDLVHINTSWAYVGALAAKRAGVHFVWHVREALEIQQHRRLMDRRFAYRLMEQADAVFAISHFVGKQYENVLGEKQIVIHDGVESERFYMQREILNSPVLTVLSVGMFLEQKGQLQLLEACRLLLSEGFSGLRVLLVGRGKGPYQEEMRRLLRDNGLESIVSFREATTRVEDYYRQADLFAMTSRDEGFGRTTAEAMLSGCLVIGADSGATPELIRDGETGLLYPHGDVRALADRIRWAAEHRKEGREIARRGQEYAREHFTIARNAENICEQYERVLRQR